MNLHPGWLTLTLITLTAGLIQICAYPIDRDEETNFDDDDDTQLSYPELSSLFEYKNELPNDWPTPYKSMPEKRGPCHGTACVYSHIGAKAGHSSLRRLKLTLLRECVDDPLCFSPGRRKRSTRKGTKGRKVQRIKKAKRQRLP